MNESCEEVPLKRFPRWISFLSVMLRLAIWDNFYFSCFTSYNSFFRKNREKWSDWFYQYGMDIQKVCSYGDFGMIIILIYQLKSIFKYVLTHLFPMHPFSTPWKHQKTLLFSDDFRRFSLRWEKMGQSIATSKRNWQLQIWRKTMRHHKCLDVSS